MTSKDVKKSIVPSFMFLFILSRFVVLYVKNNNTIIYTNKNIIQFSPMNQGNKK